MYAICNKQTGVVAYLLNAEPTLDADGLHGEVRAYDIAPDTHMIIAVADAPADFVGNAYRFDGAWHVADQAALDAEAERLASVWRADASVSMRQARLALLQADKLADVYGALAALQSPDKEAAQIEWEYATEVKRTSKLVQTLTPTLGLSEAEMDGLFKTAELF